MKSQIIIMTMIILTPIILFSQNLSNTGPDIKITFPADKDTVSYDKIRIAGCTALNAKVIINDSSVKVFPSGAFVSRVKLKPYWNEINISASDCTVTTSKMLNIFRTPPLLSSPETPTQIDYQIIYPDKNLLLFSGDLLHVRFKGSPSGQAKFSLKKICKNVPMTELPPEDANGFKGIYNGVITVITDKNCRPSPIKFELKGKDGRKIIIKTEATIEVRSNYIPLVGVITEDTYLQNGVERWSVINTMPTGTKIHIIGKTGNVYKVRLSNSFFGYISDKSVKLLDPGTPVPSTSISLPIISYNEDWIQLSMSITTACPFIINQSIDPPALELTVYSAHLGSQWITYPVADSEIKLITWSQPSADIFKLRIDLNQQQQWGHRVKLAPGRMILEIRRIPKFAQSPENPVKGLIFAIDAGHGGDELGAVGPTGLFEKDVNLAYAKKLASLLENAGAKAILTRNIDTTMTLAERFELARKSNAHMFCWLHNNSIGGVSDPLAVRGTSTYFTVPQNKGLAQSVYQRLLELGLDPFGEIQSTYYVTRQTDMLVVLIEGAFMSHPEDEMLLMDDLFLDSLARAVFLGLQDFCQTQREFSLKMIKS